MGNKGHTYTRICVACGEPFQSTGTKGRYCPKEECQRQHVLDLRQAKKISRDRRKKEGLIVERSPEEKVKAQAVRAFKKSDASIREIANKAAELGMSYGQYVGRYGK